MGALGEEQNHYRQNDDNPANPRYYHHMEIFLGSR
jgi:hypothetical protein